MRPLPWWRNVLVVDLAITLLVVIAVLVITPGVAVAGMIALLVLAGFVVHLVRGRRRRATPRRR
jgi:hypothetical protein